MIFFLGKLIMILNEVCFMFEQTSFRLECLYMID